MFSRLFFDEFQLITKQKNNKKGAMMNVSDKFISNILGAIVTYYLFSKKPNAKIIKN